VLEHVGFSQFRMRILLYLYSNEIFTFSIVIAWFLDQVLTDILAQMDLTDTSSWTTMAGSYPYKRLGQSELRLLTLQPGTWDNKIECDIEHANLDSNPDYEALSYTWGPPTDLRSIFISGYEVKVRPNLEIALRYLRRPDEGRTLWIDALSINQQDIAERNAQVPRMYTIYSKARRVLAWLGEPGADGEEGMKLMEKFGLVMFNYYARGEFKIGDRGFTWLRAQGLDICSENWAALYNLWSRQYWSRIWVIQELASSIIVSPILFFDKSVAERPERCLIGCGNHWIESKLYNSLGSYLISNKSIIDSLFNATWARDDRGASLIIATATGDEPGIFGTPVDPARPLAPALKMYRMLQRTSREFGNNNRNALAKMHREAVVFGATDERDKIYGLLALCLENDRIVPDYSIATPDFLKNLVKDHITSSQKLDILLGNRRLEQNDYPSWTPELSGFESQSPAWFHSDIHWAGRSNGETRGMEAKFDLPNGLLHVRGFVVGLISRVMGPFRSLTFDPRLSDASTWSKIDYISPLGKDLEYLEELFKFANSLDPDYRGRCWRALLLDGNHTYLDQIDPVPDSYGELFDILVGVEPPPMHLTAPGMESQLMMHLHPLYHQIRANLVDRCFFTIGDKIMAVGPYHTKPGDRVVIFYGGSPCFILRPCCHGTHFKLIGDAHVHRFMDGRMCGAVLNGEVQTEAGFFTLC
jgi:Heterokaryon incompatibility protein (HET)